MLGLAGNRLVVADERMQVAVAGVEHVADAQAGSLPRARESGAAPRAASCAARRRPARSSSATRGPSRRTPPCAPSRSARAAPDRCAISIVAGARVAGRRDSTMREELVDFRLAGRRARRSARRSVFGKFGCTAASAASIVSRSIISTAAGTMPPRDDRRTPLRPPRRSTRKPASSVVTLSGPPQQPHASPW